MPNQDNNNPDHDEIMSLLPFFVNQTLEEHERTTVTSHARNCDICQREIQFLESLNEAVQVDAQSRSSLHADIDKDFVSVMGRIDADSHPDTGLTTGASRLKQKLSEMFDFAPILTVPQWGMTALAGLLVAVLGFQLFNLQQGDNYSVLSSPGLDNTAMRLSIKVTRGGSQEQVRSSIQDEITKIGQSVEFETKPDGEYIIAFKDSVDVAELSKLIDRLESQLQIERVEVLP